MNSCAFWVQADRVRRPFLRSSQASCTRTKAKLFLPGRTLLVDRHSNGILALYFRITALPTYDCVRQRRFSAAGQALPAAQLRDPVQWALELVQLIAESHMRPTDLSGGQQQRVAIAPAIVFEPSLLLLDEPLSSLDRRLRQNLQLEIRQLQRKLGIAAVYVTHDQEEAMTLADRIVVLHDGRLDAVGTPSDLYQRPPTLFTANFLGDANSFQCSVSSNNVDALQVNVLGATMQAIGAAPDLRRESARRPRSSSGPNLRQSALRMGTSLVR